jgi:hypothetical protein
MVQVSVPEYHRYVPALTMFYSLKERELKELRQQLEAAQLEARLLRGRLAAKEEEMLKKDQEVKAEKVPYRNGLF